MAGATRWTLGDLPIRVEIHSSDQTVEIFIEAIAIRFDEERRRSTLINIPRHQFSQASGLAARRKMKLR
jgi:hypothetical protein